MMGKVVSRPVKLRRGRNRWPSHGREGIAAHRLRNLGHRLSRLDGDPLDVLVLVDAPSFPGCLMTVRPIGMLEMIDQGKEDEKILAVGTNNPIFKNIDDYRQLYPHLLLEIEHFFTVYKELEAKATKILGWQNAEKARAVVGESHDRFASTAKT